MNRNLVVAGAFFGMTGILLGAFGAHGLEKVVSPEQVQTFETGVEYQMYSALFLLIMSALPLASQKVKKICFYLTSIGIFFFSGSIYLLATNDLTSFDFSVIALVTPVGGTLLIAAWAVVLFSFLKLKIK